MEWWAVAIGKTSAFTCSNDSIQYIYQNNDVRFLPVFYLGMVGSAFWAPFFLPWLQKEGVFVPLILSKILCNLTFPLRYSAFWYHFSGNDRKKLYMISEAQEKFLEYRQIVSTEFLMHNVNELVSILGTQLLGYTTYIE